MSVLSWYSKSVFRRSDQTSRVTTTRSTCPGTPVFTGRITTRLEKSASRRLRVVSCTSASS